MKQVTLWESRWHSVRRDGDQDEFFVAGDEALVIAIEADCILLVEEPAPAFGGEPTLVLPGGLIEAGESALEAAQRELREETGHMAEDLSLVASLRPWPKYLRVTSHIVRARRLPLNPLPPDEPHPIKLHRMPVEQAVSDIASGKINDARLVAALALCRSPVWR